MSRFGGIDRVTKKVPGDGGGGSVARRGSKRKKRRRKLPLREGLHLFGRPGVGFIRALDSTAEIFPRAVSG
jgi:hypothetical protein